jgi:hypothetical protein
MIVYTWGRSEGVAFRVTYGTLEHGSSREVVVVIEVPRENGRTLPDADAVVWRTALDWCLRNEYEEWILRKVEHSGYRVLIPYQRAAEDSEDDEQNA